MRRISLLSAFEDTPIVPSFLVGGNHASTVGSSKNDMEFTFQPSRLLCIVTSIVSQTSYLSHLHYLQEQL
jgi:hypothetical protein